MAPRRTLLRSLTCAAALGLGPSALGQTPLTPARMIRCGNSGSLDQCKSQPKCANLSSPGKCTAPYSKTVDRDHDWCCCESDEKDHESQCQTDPKGDNGKCLRWCCEDGYLPCGTGCCGPKDVCGFWTHSGERDHAVEFNTSRSDVECCVPRDRIHDNVWQDQARCSAFGSGTDCRPNKTGYCALKCQPGGDEIAEPYIWCSSKLFDRSYWCQDDCGKWQPEPPKSGPELWSRVTLGISAVLAALCACACRGRCSSYIRSRREFRNLADEERPSESESECFALIIGVSTYADSTMYPPLDRLDSVIANIKETLKKVQPRLFNDRIIVDSASTSSQKILSAVDKFCVKFAGSSNATLFLFMMGHGCRPNKTKDMLVASDGSRVDVQAIVNRITRSHERGAHGYADSPNLIGIIEMCRIDVPDDSVAEPCRDPQFAPGSLTDGNPYLIYSTRPGFASTYGDLTATVLRVLKESDAPLTVTEFGEKVTTGRPAFQREILGNGSGEWTNVIINPRIYSGAP